MTAPTTPIDADVSVEWNPDMYFVLESEAIWRTENLTAAGAATWEQVYDPDADFDGAEFGGLMRVRCARTAGLIYVLGWGEEEAGTNKPFCLKSVDYGNSWSILWTDEAITAKDYTVTYRTKNTVCVGVGQIDIYTTLTHTRIGDEESTYNPWSWMYQVENNGPCWDGSLEGDATTIHDWGGTNLDGPFSTPIGRINEDLSTAQRTTAASWLTDYFGGGIGVGWDKLQAYLYGALPNTSTRVHSKYHHKGWPGYNVTYFNWVFWNKPSPVMPKAFDVAKTNSNWLYIGLMDKILKSEDGGVNWSAINVAEGANDILVDMLLAGVIYYWSTDGNLKMMVADAVQSLDLTEASAWDQHLRIAQMAGGRLFTITGDGDLKRRYQGSWETLVEDISGGRCLRVYNWDVAYLDVTAIWHSDDWGDSWEDKTGDWADYGSPVTIHYLDDITG